MIKIDKSFCAVNIDKDKCMGCTNCMKKCPTEAIRVKGGKAQIDFARCVSCGECIRTCSYKAKTSVYDALDIINKYKYKVALLPPSLFGQFKNVMEPELVANAMKNIGFDDWFEVARGADIVSSVTREILCGKDIPKPLISNACPVCVELILYRYHGLADNLMTTLPPLEISASLAREKAAHDTGLDDEDIGIFFISPCAAKICSIKRGLYTENVQINGVLSAWDVCLKLMQVPASEVSIRQKLIASNLGLAWATSGGEVSNIQKGRQLAADGILNVMNVLRELEAGKLTDIDFVELNACPGGCVGGVLNIENPFVCKSKIHSIRRNALLYKTNTVDNVGDAKPEDYKLNEWQPVNVFKLDTNFVRAFEKLQQLESLTKELPGYDCGLCGAPTCRAFAEDIVNNRAEISHCVKYKTDKV